MISDTKSIEKTANIIRVTLNDDTVFKIDVTTPGAHVYMNDSDVVATLSASQTTQAMAICKTMCIIKH
jgi:hypothetical protein